MSQSKRRVVVTGIGSVTGLGTNTSALWRNMLAGQSGVRRLQALDASDYRTPNAAEVPGRELTEALAAAGIRSLDRASDLAMLAATEAMAEAGVCASRKSDGPCDTAVIFGTGGGCAQNLYRSYHSYFEKGVRGLRPSSIPRSMFNSISSRISIEMGLGGPNYAVVSACSSATVAIGIAFRMVRDGDADRVLCGGSDAMFEPVSFSAWDNLGVMSRNPDAAAACRPFARDRDGFVLGEGAGALVIESLDCATARHAAVRAEIAGFGESSDATHITRPDPDGEARAMRAALKSAAMTPNQIGFINSHGTATLASDESESRAIRAVFGAATPRTPVSASKSFVGHLLGAAGAVETIVSILGLESGRLPPNLNLDDPDPLCDLCFVGPQPIETGATAAMNNSFGFGGNNAVLILRRYAPA